MVGVATAREPVKGRSPREVENPWAGCRRRTVGREVLAGEGRDLIVRWSETVLWEDLDSGLRVENCKSFYLRARGKAARYTLFRW